MKPTIRITTQKDVHLSKSFFGGLPKLPTNFEWPVWDATSYYPDEIKYAENSYRDCGTGFWRAKIKQNQKKLLEPLVPLLFLGQIYLEETPHYGSFPNLPLLGILCFFWDAFLAPPGFRNSSKGSCRVIYIEDISELKTPSFPTGMVEKFRDRIYVQPNDFRCSYHSSLVGLHRITLVQFLQHIVMMMVSQKLILS